jgi:purine-cytosine permease-like protein
VNRVSRTTKIVLGAALSVPAVALFTLLPPFLSFATAIAAASCWCYWLERHPLNNPAHHT